jgi:hypothetical protein
MRQRVTFLQEPVDSVDPKFLDVTSNSISAKQLKAALEHRTTFGFDELPQELYRVLKASHELHIRWVSQINFETIAPVVARLSPGLHIYYTPQRNSNNSYVAQLRTTQSADTLQNSAMSFVEESVWRY